MGSTAVKFTLYALLILVLFAHELPAAEETEQTTRLEEMTVVATPIIQGNEVDRYASQKTSVSESQIDDLNAQDLATALRRTPGVNISRYNPVGSFGGATGGAVFIRGFGSSRPGAEIKTLVDGVPMYMSVWNHPLLDLMTIDPAHSIEVYKSPQPHVFGNAYAVVNIIPKRKATEGFRTKGKAAGGSYSTWVGTAEHGGKQDRFDYYLGGGYRTSDGHRDNADGELKDLYGRAGYRLTDNWDLSVFGLWNDNYADDPGREGADPAEREGRYETRTTMTVATIANHYGAAEGHIKLYWNQGEGDWLSQPTGTPGVREDLFNDFLYYGLKAREALRPWDGGELILGLDWDITEGDYDQRFSDGTTDRWEGHDFTIFSPYTAISQRFGRKDGFYVIPSAGVRYYDNSDFDEEWAPHAGLILGYRDTEFHAGYSRGVIYPGLEVVVLSEKIIPPLGKSWQNLSAETVDHFEIGIRQRFGSLAVADLTGFYDEGQDRYVIVPPPPPPPVFDNIEEYRIKGLEATLSLYPTDDLSLFGGVTFLDTEPSDLPYAPEVTLSAGLVWRFLEAFKLRLDCEYLDDMFVSEQARRSGAENINSVDSYFLVNAKLGYLFAISAWDLKGEIFIAGENLTDADYEYLSGYPMPGINGMLGVSFVF
jgi:iron complex outermembrane receptor protein